MDTMWSSLLSSIEIVSQSDYKETVKGIKQALDQKREMHLEAFQDFCKLNDELYFNDGIKQEKCIDIDLERDKLSD